MKELQFDSIIFDVDGTLWDSTGTLAEAYSAASEAFAQEDPCGLVTHRSFTAEEVRKELGQPTIEIFHHLYPELKDRASAAGIDPEPVYERLMLRSIDFEYDYLEKTGGRLYDGLKETLEALAEKYRLFIVSNCEKGYIELFTGYSGTGQLFEDWLCFGDTGLEKDRTIRQLAERNALKAPVYIGDILKDALSSRKAGAGFIWASYGFGQVPEELYDAKAGCFRDIARILSCT